MFLLPLLHVLNVLDNFITHEPEGVVQHLGCLPLLAGHDVQTGEHLADADGHVEAARHALPPAPRAVAVLQSVQFLCRLGNAVVHHVLVEEVGQPQLLLRLAVGIVHPGSLLQQDVLQFLVLFQLAEQRAVGRRLLFPAVKDVLDVAALRHERAGDEVRVEPCRLVNGILLDGIAY